MADSKFRMPAGARIFGANIVPKAANVAYDSGLQAWSQMMLTWDWAGWVKPQIDNLVGNGIGANCFRIVGCCGAIYQGKLTQAAHDGYLLQVANYLNSLGCYFYVVLNDTAHDCVQLVGQPESLKNAIADIMATTALKLQALPNVICLDVIGEVYESSYGLSTAQDLLQRLKIRNVTLPLTCSVAEAIDPVTGNATTANIVAAWADVIILHLYPYHQGTGPQPLNKLNYFRTTYPQKDILIGEFGTEQGSFVAYEDSYNMDILRIIDQPDQYIRGGLMWAATDQGTLNGDRWGIFDDTFAIRQSKANLLRRYTGGSLAKSLALHR